MIRLERGLWAQSPTVVCVSLIISKFLLETMGRGNYAMTPSYSLSAQLGPTTRLGKSGALPPIAAAMERYLRELRPSK